MFVLVVSGLQWSLIKAELSICDDGKKKNITPLHGTHFVCSAQKGPMQALIKNSAKTLFLFC